MSRNLPYFYLFIIGIFVLPSCQEQNKTSEFSSFQFDLDRIKERGKIIALIDNSSYSYFIYKGKPMGFEFELLSAFAKSQDLELEVKIVRDINELFQMLQNGEGDVIAYNLTVTNERKKQIAFTDHYAQARQMLIQKKPNNWRRISFDKLNKKLIRNPIDLDGDTIVVRKGSAFIARLENLSDEIGGKIFIKEADSELETEDLIKMVRDGKIKYTIADENVARLNATFHSGIDAKTAISLPQKIALGLRQNDEQLKTALNDWFKKNKTKKAIIYNKYFKSRTRVKNLVNSSYYSNTSGKISRYDEAIKTQAKKLNWDWRLLTALVYQESKFDPQAKSWAGATGLMQMISTTAAQYGLDSNLVKNPYANLNAGTKYLQYLDELWSKHIPDSTERIKFVLASYNVGLGHIIDARNLAKKYDKDQNVWDDNVAEFILKKSLRRFYNDPVVKSGYCRGQEPYNYVKSILKHYEHYRTLVHQPDSSLIN